MSLSSSREYDSEISGTIKAGVSIVNILRTRWSLFDSRQGLGSFLLASASRLALGSTKSPI